MAPLVVAGIIEAIKTVIDRQVPDKNVANQVKAQLDTQESVQAFQVALAQIGVNLEEVKSGHWLGKWRGALGWGCVAAFIYQLVVYPTLVGLVVWIDPAFPVDKLPVLELKQLVSIMMGMLGLGV